MESRLKYTEDKFYDMEDDFMDFFHSCNPFLAFKIAQYLDRYLKVVPNNQNITQIRAGVVRYEGESVFFAVEIVKIPGLLMSLSDIDLISADEYLDLRNMNYYIKTNDENPYYVNPDSLLNV
ncbi:MAG: hypothetical protein GOVbin962_74 [Prokaryotic dsDNA virus sp.]|nr:MAG: hypothetical protein GOVbin962_74 [Prokaryotic dsDNA virus sp.]|tara:strand:- start:23927 stop:24292 length:366 start_codon:yes stop_codon:yes gene_type:complete